MKKNLNHSFTYGPVVNTHWAIADSFKFGFIGILPEQEPGE